MQAEADTERTNLQARVATGCSLQCPEQANLICCISDELPIQGQLQEMSANVMEAQAAEKSAREAEKLAKEAEAAAIEAAKIAEEKQAKASEEASALAERLEGLRDELKQAQEVRCAQFHS